LHRPARTGRVLDALFPAGGVGVAAVVAFELADAGEQRPGNIEGEPRLLVEE
jgi:hypothetical protein